MSSPHEESVIFSHTKKYDSPIMVESKPSSPSAGSWTPPVDAAADRRLMWKVDIHVVPILFAIYILAFLDRVNIGNAKIQVCCISYDLLNGIERR
jgi:hypothetical protein